MTLPSQTARSTRVTTTRPAGRGYRPKAVRRRRFALAVVLVVLLAVLLGGWRWLSNLGGSPQSASAAQTEQQPVADADTRAAGDDDDEDRRMSTADISHRRPDAEDGNDDAPITRPEPIGREARRDETESADPSRRVEPESNRSEASPDVLTMGETPDGRTTTPTATTSRASSTPAVASRIENAVGMIPSAPIKARDALNRVLHDPSADPATRLEARRALESLNDEIFFSPRTVPGDPLADQYVVRSGDTLGAIASRNGLMIDWRLLMRVNGISDARRIRVGQTLKLINGPFHAKIDKSDYRLDIYAEKRDSGGNRLFITSYDIGLGEYDSTPVGSWVVRPRSKLLDPAWTNPRTGERYASDDPENPVGECWLGLDGTDENTREFVGYGIHGTIEPDSIGGDESMGCIRLLPGEIDQVWELLVEGESTVQIVP